MRPFFTLSEEGQLTLDTSFVESNEFKIKSWVNSFKQNSAFLSLLAERYHVLKAMQTQPNSRGDQSEAQKTLPDYMSLCTANPNPIYVDSYRLNKYLINEIATYCKSLKIRFMLVCISLIGPEKEAEYKSIDPSFNANCFDQDLGDFADSIGADYLGLQKPFRASYEKTGTALLGHWNSAGHRWVSEELSFMLKNSIFKNDTLPQQ
jgi:hypothetical protein